MKDSYPNTEKGYEEKLADSKARQKELIKRIQKGIEKKSLACEKEFFGWEYEDYTTGEIRKGPRLTKKDKMEIRASWVDCVNGHLEKFIENELDSGCFLYLEY